MIPLVRPGDATGPQGERAGPGMIERALQDHPSVARAAVCATAGEPGRLIAFVAPAGEALSLRRLREHLAAAGLVSDRAGTPEPEFVTMAAKAHDADDAWTTEGLTQALDDLTRRRAPYVPPDGPTQRHLADMWEDLLMIDGIGLHDDFFSLGGHSLLAVRVRMRLQRDLGVEVSPELLFENSVLRDQADAVDRVRLDLGAS
ncbi:phosphopantetheine-binding protein [Streptomyces sp. QH1-20]|uniref:phosphopantetheine-binding protein n=1 Tax=Streptomyces sp. QH1-20 TaxID=3240934 RepID=UPI003516E841